MTPTTRWVLLAHRLPREPSTPRIAIWRTLRRLGAIQVADGVVALPLDARTRERLEWVAEEITDRGGEATLWLAEPATAAQGRALADAMSASTSADYARLVAEAQATASAPAGTRRRTLGRLRRELRRIRARDYFPSTASERAHAAVEALGDALEIAS
ncbi:MAG TPA: Chromate resistance protein ChrB [Candidatus Limnocylindrales bacterium]